MSVLVSGSIALDHIKTQTAEQGNLLGGSAAYAAIAASFFAPTSLVGVVGRDFPEEHMKLFQSKGLNLDGLEQSQGDTFRWSGEYMEDMNQRETLDVALNVLESWKPVVAESQKADTKLTLLANSHPQNQHSVLDQVAGNSHFSIADTMDLWIQISRPELDRLLKRIDLLVLNDGEAKLMMETSNVVEAGERLRKLGPKYVIVKKGEHGAMLFGKDKDEFFTCPAFPLREVFDPTGAGDTFIGGFTGFLASRGNDDYNFEDLASAVVRGSIMASFACESFGTQSLRDLTPERFEERLSFFRGICQFS